MCYEYIINLDEKFRIPRFRWYIFGSTIDKILKIEKFKSINKIIKDTEVYIRENYIYVPKDIKQEFLNCINDKRSLRNIVTEYENKIGRYYLDFFEYFIANGNLEDQISVYFKDMIDNLSNHSNCNIVLNDLLKFIFGKNDGLSNFFVHHDMLYKLLIEVAFPRFHKNFVNKMHRQSIYNLLGYNSEQINYYEQNSNKYNIWKINLMSFEEVENLVKIIIKEYHSGRVRITKNKVCARLFGDCLKGDRLTNYYHKLNYYEEINSIIENGIGEMEQLYIDGNRDEMDISKPICKIYYKNNLSLYSEEVDLSEFKSEELRREIWIYLKGIFIQDNAGEILHDISRIKTSLLLLEQDYEIKRIKDIKEHHILLLIHMLQIKDNNKIKTVSMKVSALTKLFEFYIKKIDYKYRPTINYCERIKLINIDSHSKNTSIIPDEVLYLIDKHSEDINESYRLIFKLLWNTGCRYKEIILLEKNAFELDPYDNNFVIMYYTPYKILVALKKNGLAEKLLTHIPIELYYELQIYIKSTEKSRRGFGIKQIFFSEHNGQAVDITSANFNLELNRVMERNNIITWEGSKWRFTSKQTRKTLAVDLINSDATISEVQHTLGHMSQQTTQQYYAEVKKMKLAELNSEFYRKRFNHIIGDEKLNLFGEEERKLLYVDFCLNKREVEFGNCLKHPSEGYCKDISQPYCPTCPKICTGLKYLSKWQSLLDSKLETINNLLERYKEHSINEVEYRNYAEYKREVKFLNHYKVVIDAIKEGS